MTASPTSHTGLAADIRQLTQPIHVAIRGQIITHPPLLTQLRDATTPTGGRSNTTSRPAPASRPAARLDVVDVLTDIYVGLAAWRTRLRLPSPPRDTDWQMHILSALPAAATTLDAPVAEWLGIDIHSWWHDAAVATGWQPADLRRLR